MRILTVFIGGVGVALVTACAPKPLPDWAMKPGVRQPAVIVDTVKSGIRLTRRKQPLISSARSDVSPHATRAELKLYTPEWYAREQAVEDQLRRRTRICGTC
jgi:hypothetical protein